MPISKSSKRALRNSLYKQARNQKTMVGLEIALKKATKDTLASVISRIDKVAKVNLISKGRANRLKAKTMKKFDNPATIKPRATKLKTDSLKVKTKVTKTKATKPTTRKSSKKLSASKKAS